MLFLIIKTVLIIFLTILNSLLVLFLFFLLFFLSAEILYFPRDFFKNNPSNKGKERKRKK